MLIPARSGAENMARDTALMERARESGEYVFSVYGWTVPTLSLGRNQTARGRYDPVAIRRHGVDVVRRPTGGRALLHHREVTYSVTAPANDGEQLRDTFSRINRILIGGLFRLGVSATEARGTGPAPHPGDLPCFAAPAEGELVTAGGKIAGSAQVREAGALLQHGSILIDDDQPLIAELLGATGPDVESVPAATLRAALGRAPSVSEVASALFDAVRQLEDADALQMAEADVQQATARHLERYASERWTWRM